MSLDVALFRWLNGFAGHHRVLDALMSAAASYAPLVVVVVLLACWGRWRRPWQRAAGLAAWLLAFSVVVLVARVYVGVHYPEDVLGGALLGAAAGWVAVRLARTPMLKRWIAAVLDQLARLHLAATNAGPAGEGDRPS